MANEQRKDEWTIPAVQTVRHHGREYQLHEGFNFEGTFITDPTKSPDGRFDVDPEQYYGCDYLNWRDREENARTSKRWTQTKIGNWYS